MNGAENLVTIFAGEQIDSARNLHAAMARSVDAEGPVLIEVKLY